MKSQDSLTYLAHIIENQRFKFLARLLDEHPSTLYADIRHQYLQETVKSAGLQAYTDSNDLNEAKDRFSENKFSRKFRNFSAA